MLNAGTSIAISPLLPWVLLLPLFALAALAVGFALFRRARGALWRLLALAVLATALLNPSLVREEREPIKDVAAIVVDESPSQNIGPRRARTEAALADLQKRLASFNDLEVRIVRAGGAPAEADAAATGAAVTGAVEETKLFEALDRATADVPRRRMAGAVLITDGQVHDVPGVQRKLAEYGPIQTLLSGDHDEADRRIAIVQAPSFGIVGKPVTLTVKVEDLPKAQSTEAVVTVRQDGGPPKPFKVPVGKEQQLDFTLEHGGQNVFELEVQPAAQELTLTNNRAAIVVNGVRDRLRVLLVSGEPHAGERTWRNLLKADPSVDLVHFTILRPPEKQDGTPIKELSLIAFPIRELFEVKLDEFDLIIFDRYRRRGVLPQLYLSNIAHYVQRGGALLEAGGPGDPTALSLYRTPLGEVLPAEPNGEVIEQAFRPKVTEIGRRHPVTADLPGDSSDGEPTWGRWFRMAGTDALDGSVVMQGAQGRPLLVLNRVGQGRVAQITSDQLWLWSRGFEGGGPQAELLRRLAHWLMKEPELEENDLRAKVEGNRITIERRSLKPGNAAVDLTSPSDAKRKLDLTDRPDGLASATVLATEPGIWRVTDGERTALAVVGAINPPELADVRTTPDRLAPATEASGGTVHWIADQPAGIEVRRTRPDRDQGGRNWIGLRSNGDYIVRGVSDAPLLPVALVLFLAVGALLAGWRREGR